MREALFGLAADMSGTEGLFVLSTRAVSGPVYFRNCANELKSDISACAVRGTMGLRGTGLRGIKGGVGVLRFGTSFRIWLSGAIIIDETFLEYELEALLEEVAEQSVVDLETLLQ